MIILILLYFIEKFEKPFFLQLSVRVTSFLYMTISHDLQVGMNILSFEVNYYF